MTSLIKSPLLMGFVNKLKVEITDEQTLPKSFLHVFVPGNHTELMEGM